MAGRVIILLMGISCLIFVGIPYVFYYLGIKLGKVSERIQLLQKYPPISIVISAYNEEKNVEKRIENLALSGYPDLEIIFVDDCSEDNTAFLAREILMKYQLKYVIIKNKTRLGVSKAYNRGISTATNNIVVTTDADVLFGENALQWLISRLLSRNDIGAVSGDLQPVKNENATTNLEGSYRSFYGKMGDWESSHDSTFNFNGAMIAFKKDAVPGLSEFGADDANTAFSAIRNGYRAVYEMKAVVYEDIPANIEIQYNQKVRRATGLIEAVLANTDLLRMNRQFSHEFYPMRILMIVVAPVVFFIGAALIAFAGILINPVITGVCLILLELAILKSQFLSAFILNQICLVSGLWNLGKDVRAWESTSSLER